VRDQRRHQPGEGEQEEQDGGARPDRHRLQRLPPRRGDVGRARYRSPSTCTFCKRTASLA
jgi:hypothetical protein